MGWFDAIYGRPGHGVEPNAPRKKGLARFAEIVGRDLGALLGCNLLCCLLCLPAALLLSLGVVLQQFWLSYNQWHRKGPLATGGIKKSGKK